METPNESWWMRAVDKTFWPILFILIIIAISVVAESAQAQDMVSVERWRLEKACQELILLDSLVEDHKQKDSVISDLKKLNETRMGSIASYKGLVLEKDLQIDMHRSMSNSLIKENHIWKAQAKRFRRQRTVAVIILGGLGVWSIAK